MWGDPAFYLPHKPSWCGSEPKLAVHRKVHTGAGCQEFCTCMSGVRWGLETLNRYDVVVKSNQPGCLFLDTSSVLKLLKQTLRWIIAQVTEWLSDKWWAHPLKDWELQVPYSLYTCCMVGRCLLQVTDESTPRHTILWFSFRASFPSYFKCLRKGSWVEVLRKSCVWGLRKSCVWGGVVWLRKLMCWALLMWLQCLSVLGLRVRAGELSFLFLLRPSGHIASPVEGDQ